MTTTARDKLAGRFAEDILTLIGLDALATVCDRNRTPQYVDACATHDFCDANMVMLAAWTAVVGAEPAFLDAEHADEAKATQDAELWDGAWEYARNDVMPALLFLRAADNCDERIAEVIDFWAGGDCPQDLWDALHAARRIYAAAHAANVPAPTKEGP